MARALQGPAGRARLPAWSVERWLNHAGPLSLADLRGRVVMLLTFQMLCPGCVAQALPQAQRVQEDLAGADLAVIGLHTVFEHHEAMGPKALEAFIHEYRLSFPIGVDLPRDESAVPHTMARYGLRGTPSLLLLDREGYLRRHHFGHLPDLHLGVTIAGLIAEEMPGKKPATSKPELPVAPAGEATGCETGVCLS